MRISHEDYFKFDLCGAWRGASEERFVGEKIEEL